MYTYTIIVASLTYNHKQEGVSPGEIKPLNIIKLFIEQEGLFLAPNFDINNFPYVFVKGGSTDSSDENDILN